MFIREAKQTDTDALVDLLGELFSIEEDFEFDAARQRAGLDLMLSGGSAQKIWVADEDGRVVGMCSLQVLVSTAEGSRVGLVEDVVVHRAFRGQGVGSSLMKHLLQWSMEEGLSRLQLLADRTNAPALTFYEKLGWGRTQLICLRRRVEKL